MLWLRLATPIMRVLITGITGFAGGHLAEAVLAEKNVELFGVSRQGTWPARWSYLKQQVGRLYACDLCDGDRLEAIVRETQPEQIYHLAGYAHVGRSFQEAETAWRDNLTATRRLYEAVVRWGGSPRILYVSSGLIYGDPEQPGHAYDENSQLRPTSPYAASKAAADLMSYQYTRAPGLPIIRVRPFNHIGPRQSTQYAVAHFAAQLAAIKQGKKPPLLETGNLSTRRDLTDVRDMVHAYQLLMEKGRIGEAYNVGVGQTYSMKEVLDRLIELAGVQVEIRQRSELVRSTETLAVHVEASRLRRETGWLPRFILEQTLADTLAYWSENP